jgi:hypothetical protein
MAITPLKHVAPGDLITAAFFNEVIDALSSLQAQIDDLPTGQSTPGGPVITQIKPDKVRAGAAMTIIGKNFAVPGFLNTLKLTNLATDTGSKIMRALDDIVSGTDTSVVAGVPGDLPDLPRTLLLTLETIDGKAERQVLIDVPKVDVKGAVKVLNITAPLGDINVDGTYVFQLQLDASGMNIAERFTIDVTYANAVGAKAEAWKAATLLVGATATSQVNVDPRESVTVGVQFKVPKDATSVDMTVRAISVNNDPDSSGSSPVIPIVVGEPPLPTDTSIGLSIPAVNKPFIHSKKFTGTIAGDGLEVAFGRQGIAAASASIKHGGTYVFNVEIENEDGTSWQVANMPKTVSMDDDDTTIQNFGLKLAPNTAKDVRRFARFTANRTEKSGVGEISNYLRFPIDGFTEQP